MHMRQRFTMLKANQRHADPVGIVLLSEEEDTESCHVSTRLNLAVRKALDADPYYNAKFLLFNIKGLKGKKSLKFGLGIPDKHGIAL